MRKAASLVGVFSVLAGICFAGTARADASAWVFLGGGGMAWKQSEDKTWNPGGTMVIDAGVGSSPDGPVIVGGLFRIQPILPGGVDLALLTRVASRGFQAGDWGVAVDVGGFGRAWGSRSIGFAGSASVGMPLGVTLMLQTELGIDHAFTFGAVAGIDLLRLTIYRRTLLKWWQNPSPAYSQTAGASPSGFRF